MPHRLHDLVGLLAGDPELQGARAEHHRVGGPGVPRAGRTVDAVGEQLVAVPGPHHAHDRGADGRRPADHHRGPGRQVRGAEDAEERLVDHQRRGEALPVTLAEPAALDRLDAVQRPVGGDTPLDLDGLGATRQPEQRLLVPDVRGRRDVVPRHQVGHRDVPDRRVRGHPGQRVVGGDTDGRRPSPDRSPCSCCTCATSWPRADTVVIANTARKTADQREDDAALVHPHLVPRLGEGPSHPVMRCPGRPWRPRARPPRRAGTVGRPPAGTAGTRGRRRRGRG